MHSPERWRYTSGLSTPGGRMPWSRSAFAVGDQLAARADDQRVRRAQVLVGAVVDRAHALGHRHVLLADAADAGVALPLALGLAVDQVVVGQVSGRG